MVGPMRKSAFRLRFRYSCESGWEINSASSRRAEVDPFRGENGACSRLEFLLTSAPDRPVLTAKIRFHPSPSSTAQQRMSQWASGYQPILQTALSVTWPCVPSTSPALLEAFPHRSDQAKSI